MENDKKEEDSRPHFVDVNYPEKEPWKTDIFFGQRDGSVSHAHLVASGAIIWYLRDEEGKEIIKDGKESVKNISQ